MKPTWRKVYPDPLVRGGGRVRYKDRVQVEEISSVRDTQHPEQTFRPDQLKRIWNAAHYTNAMREGDTN